MHRPVTLRSVASRAVAPKPVSPAPRPAAGPGGPARPAGTFMRPDLPPAVRERRARAARFRATIAAALSALALAGWALVAMTSIQAWAAAIPTLLLAGVVYAGRRAVVLNARNDIVRYGLSPVRRPDLAPVAPPELPRPVEIADVEVGGIEVGGVEVGGVEVGSVEVGSADLARDSEDTQLLEIARARLEANAIPSFAPARPAASFASARPTSSFASAKPAPKASDDVAAPAARLTKPPKNDARSWTPTHVPAPAYTLSAEAARWEPNPLTDADYEAARAAAARLTHASPEDTGKIAIAPRTIFRDDPAIDVDAALMKRRRASGS